MRFTDIMDIHFPARTGPRCLRPRPSLRQQTLETTYRVRGKLRACFCCSCALAKERQDWQEQHLTTSSLVGQRHSRTDCSIVPAVCFEVLSRPQANRSICLYVRCCELRIQASAMIMLLVYSERETRSCLPRFVASKARTGQLHNCTIASLMRFPTRSLF